MIKRNPKRVLLTGGHAATAAYAVCESIIKRKHFKEIFWIGVKGAIEGKNIETLESQILPPLGVATHWIPGGRIQRTFTIWTIPSILKFALSFFVSISLLFKIKPYVILSFGGGVSFPVVLAGFLLGIPVVVHDQTATAGRANEIASLFAKKIILSRNSSLNYFPQEKSVVLGNPVRDEILKIKPKNGLVKSILITGGSRGSTSLNSLIKPNIKKLLEKYKIIHQTGAIDYEVYAELKTKLPEQLSERYMVYPNLDLNGMAKFYEECDLVISRSGANTVSEILAIGRPSLLVPIPWSYKNEQVENAKYAETLGVAKIFPQNGSSDNFLKAIEEQARSAKDIHSIFKDWSSPDSNAAKKIATFLEEI